MPHVPLPTFSDSLGLSFPQLPLIFLCVNAEQPHHHHTRHTGELYHHPNTILPPFFLSHSGLFLSFSLPFLFLMHQKILTVVSPSFSDARPPTYTTSSFSSILKPYYGNPSPILRFDFSTKVRFGKAQNPFLLTSWGNL